MPAQIPRTEIMDEDQLMKEVLDKFVNCHEQTYEEFLSTFTHLSKEDNVAKEGVHGTDSTENIFTTEKLNHKIESNGRHFRNTTIFHTSSEYSEEEQIVIDEGHKVGSSFQGDMTRAAKVKVDNFLDLEDVDMEEESKLQMNKDWLLLPGEVEQTISTSVPAYVPSVDLPLTSEVKPEPAVGRTQKQTEEILGDEVQPFFLDEEFDYDNVTLTPKFTAGEIATIQELSKQRRVDSSTDVCELHD
ncbi:intraflagellar transport-associated protein [Arvicanthis niloticus]|uniref:intraflagellar transport-associated protein n=1 Tax=Arvicanthis niloticus TaxID=61156 RepID=UPI00148675D6|nr:intraflagellar transport-associated protein [Arvicanthis niloticus]XP_034351134.1 intraflagellar transport-associated protein [Arvicanthis niloticus]